MVLWSILRPILYLIDMKSKAVNDKTYDSDYQSQLSCNLTTRSIISHFT